MTAGLTQILHGDYRGALAQLEPGSVDLVLTDPPYGTTALKWDTAPNLAEFWQLINRVLKETGVVVSFCAQPFTTDLINSNRKEFRYELIWSKTCPVGFLDSKMRPLRAHENIVIFARKLKASTYNPQMTVGTPYTRKRTAPRETAHYGKIKDSGMPTNNTGTRYPRSVLHHNNKQRPALHPTQKPLDLVEWLVRTYSNEGELVLDPFMGSGTTVVAAARCGRRAIGIEREADYIAKAAQRLATEVAA